jgi:hypothetical protein
MVRRRNLCIFLLSGCEIDKSPMFLRAGLMSTWLPYSRNNLSSHEKVVDAIPCIARKLKVNYSIGAIGCRIHC